VSKLVVVSNRVAVPRPGAPPAAGGVAVALKRALQRDGGVWFGWSGRTTDAPDPQKTVVAAGDVTYALLDLPTDDFAEYYNGFSNRTLWPLMHYRLDLTEFARADLAAYHRVNRRFAEALRPHIDEDSLVWVHDYHLIPMAAELRRLGVRNRIGYFHHIPWPAADVFATLPRHRELAEALLAYDLVGLHTRADADNLGSYLERELDRAPSERGVVRHPAGAMRLGVFPIGIETRSFATRARRARPLAFVRDIDDSLMGRKLLIGVDRLDYSKGVAQRMEAFEAFLKANPEACGAVTYLQITPKSRSEVPEYAEVERRVSEAAGRINGAFGEASWTPIRYVNRPYSRTALAGLYRRAEVGLVTPFRDGMNMVAKEYVAAQDPENPGVLVLSRFAGAATELGEAVLVNPYDTEGMAQGIARALAMPREERKARWRPMFDRLLANDIDHWSRIFLDELRGTGSPGLGAWLRGVFTAEPQPASSLPTARRAALF
jgi:trehalose 6-phosphate synthase